MFSHETIVKSLQKKNKIELTESDLTKLEKFSKGFRVAPEHHPSDRVHVNKYEMKHVKVGKDQSIEYCDNMDETHKPHGLPIACVSSRRSGLQKMREFGNILAAKGIRFIVFNIPGFEKDKGGIQGQKMYSSDAAVDFLYYGLQRLGVEKVVLFSSSYGERIIAKFAKTYSHLVSGVVIEDPLNSSALTSLPPILKLFTWSGLLYSDKMNNARFLAHYYTRGPGAVKLFKDRKTIDAISDRVPTLPEHCNDLQSHFIMEVENELQSLSETNPEYMAEKLTEFVWCAEQLEGESCNQKISKM